MVTGQPRDEVVLWRKCDTFDPFSDLGCPNTGAAVHVPELDFALIIIIRIVSPILIPYGRYKLSAVGTKRDGCCDTFGSAVAPESRVQLTGFQLEYPDVPTRRSAEREKLLVRGYRQGF